MWLTSSSVIVMLVTLIKFGGGSSFSNQWATKIPGGLEHAKKVAEDTGCELMFEIIPGKVLDLEVKQ